MEEKYMLRAIELAKQGIGAVNPNPMVGAVIVKDNEIIGEGYHKKYGDLHGERHAFANATKDCKGGDMYVTLEPCCHYGKQPPCTQAIIEHGIKNVYIGSNDPNPLVAGKGIEILREHGIYVETHVLKELCDEMNAIFFHYITTKTPYVVMKYAMSLDGKTACHNGVSQWITSETARNHVQETRNALSGIMVGVKTVLMDNPSLTCRIPGGRNPIRIICDSHLETPLESNIVQTANQVPTIIATLSQDQEKIGRYEKAGVTLLYPKEKQGRVDLSDLMILLGERKLDSILLEGGGTLNHSALQAGIVNHVHAYIAPKILGGMGGYSPVTGVGVDDPQQGYFCENQKITMLGDDILLEYDVTKKGGY